MVKQKRRARFQYPALFSGDRYRRWHASRVGPIHERTNGSKVAIGTYNSYIHSTFKPIGAEEALRIRGITVVEDYRW